MRKKFLLFIQKNPFISKYGLGMIVIFFMILGIRTYMNYLAIEISIENVNQNTIQIRQGKLYEEKFLIPYEQSEYSQYFLRHENNILFPNEFVIRLEREQEQKTQITEQENRIDSPQESWAHFFQSIRDRYQ